MDLGWTIQQILQDTSLLYNFIHISTLGNVFLPFNLNNLEKPLILNSESIPNRSYLNLIIADDFKNFLYKNIYFFYQNC